MLRKAHIELGEPCTWGAQEGIRAFLLLPELRVSSGVQAHPPVPSTGRGPIMCREKAVPPENGVWELAVKAAVVSLLVSQRLEPGGRKHSETRLHPSCGHWDWGREGWVSAPGRVQTRVAPRHSGFCVRRLCSTYSRMREKEPSWPPRRLAAAPPASAPPPRPPGSPCRSSRS